MRLIEYKAGYKCTNCGREDIMDAHVSNYKYVTTYCMKCHQQMNPATFEKVEYIAPPPEVREHWLKMKENWGNIDEKKLQQ